MSFSDCITMVKGQKRHFPANNNGKWFAQPVQPETETRNRETCTSTGIMLSQVKSSLPQALNSERFPKWKTQQESREFPYSDHDNKFALKDDIALFTSGVGLRKCPDDLRQTNSHFCLCHIEANSRSEVAERKITIYEMDFMGKPAVYGPTTNRRFPRNHRLKSAEAALELGREPFMWFGRHDCSPSNSGQGPGGRNHSAPSKL